MVAPIAPVAAGLAVAAVGLLLSAGYLPTAPPHHRAAVLSRVAMTFPPFAAVAEDGDRRCQVCAVSCAVMCVYCAGIRAYASRAPVAIVYERHVRV